MSIMAKENVKNVCGNVIESEDHQNQRLLLKNKYYNY